MELHNLFTNEVIVKNKMLHMGVEYWISTKVHHTNIITVVAGEIYQAHLAKSIST